MDSSILPKNSKTVGLRFASGINGSAIATTSTTTTNTTSDMYKFGGLVALAAAFAPAILELVANLSTGHVEIVRMLVANGASVEMPDSAHNIPVMVAAAEGHAAVVALLLERGACCNVTNLNMWTPLMKASREANVDAVAVLFNQKRATVSFRRGDFMESRASVNLRRSNGEQERCLTNHQLLTPLMRAAGNGTTQLVALLLKKRATIDMQGPNGNSALELASAYGHLDVVTLLVEIGALIDLADDEGDTALICAAETGHVSVVRFLSGIWRVSRLH
ncbi:hypothetical protein ON010_g4755 [Phytophthora cinnamomi]|nr:hypothetical protein ON010_g4755 [Phytophthora cinnamomi]